MEKRLGMTGKLLERIQQESVIPDGGKNSRMRNSSLTDCLKKYFIEINSIIKFFMRKK